MSDTGINSEPTLSVLIATFRRAEGLARLLRALAPQVRGHAGREIIVVNDGSHDEAYAAVVAEHHDLIRYDALPENGGIGPTRNRAAALARYDYIVYTDDDCEPPAWWLDWLASRLNNNPELDILAGTTRPLWSEKPSFIERVQGHYQLLPHPWGMANGLNLFVTANVAIRRALFLKLGGFAPLRGAEDTEFALRAAQDSARIVIDQDWYVSHEVGGPLLSHMRRYAGYGYTNVHISRLTVATPMHLGFARATRRKLPGHLLQVWKETARRSGGFSENRLSRLVSIAAATAIRSSHYLGCARAARENRRALAEAHAGQERARPP